jgi:hypothetical protein
VSALFRCALDVFTSIPHEHQGTGFQSINP